jgi:hypothetical protein
LVSITGLSTSQQSQPACPQAALIADARAQAQALASAAGGSLGAIDGISAPAPTETAVYAVLPGLLEVGSFSSFGIAPAPTGCSLLVQFPLY